MKTEADKIDHARENAAGWAETIAEHVKCMECDRDRLDELREELGVMDAELPNAENADTPEGIAAIEAHHEWTRENGEELAELIAASKINGEELDEEEARDLAIESALSVRIFGERIDGKWEADRFEILLTWGGPALRIVGELDKHMQARSAQIEYRDWGTPWTRFHAIEHDTLLKWVNCFCFE